MTRKLLITIVIALFTLIGCTINQQTNDNKNSPEMINVKNTTNETKEIKNGQEAAKHLVDLASSIPNVNDATAIVLGDFAVVGIDVNSQLDRSKVSTIKYSVAESLKKDPYGANAIVIADPDTNVRLKQMATDIRNGHPIKGIMDELSAIVNRVMPEVPNDLIETNRKIDPTKKPNRELNDKDKQELEKEQIEESEEQQG
ncbi:YhcN/YlaJ family sporulation lipoprotein [Cytobacillus sp. IB215316]|uniref:YhcN/YlaJ family sporulation lipoprotein n=1 Tax=Cytobacillus sp. IB215316 TaxID=3097354 RepID=UPI002A0BFB09|nr:YhcN/YlaJ family sporulation lipoprotein [Cytobacillus sp. IB215316]MDX8359947.1 YhcN/YlaJ family sporulation lipoprotein [Cytobacillus sp. IB215316]